MKKLLLICGLLWSAVASAQFVPGQILTAAQLNSAFALYAPLTGATFSGPVSVGNFSSSGTLSGVGFTNLLAPYATTANLALKAPTASPTFTGTVTIPSGASIAGFAPLASPTFTGTPTVPGYLTTASATATYAPLASPTFTGNVTINTLAASGAIAPSQTAGITGTTTNNNANAGSVGEFISTSSTAVAITSGTSVSVTSISLSPGDWDVEGLLQTNPAGTTTQLALGVGISTVANTFSSITGGFTNASLIQSSALGTGSSLNEIAPITRLSLSTTTTVFLIGFVNYGVSTLTVSGFIRARRIR